MTADLVACAKSAKEIAEQLQKLEAKAQDGIEKYFKRRSAEDVAVLVTMLERCASSSKANLHADFEKHRIPDRVDRIRRMVCGIHYHDWCNGQDHVGSFLECAGRQDKWNTAKERALYVTAGVMGILTLGVGTAICGYKLYQLEQHVKEMERDLKFLVEEIDALYDQTQTIMIANLM